MDGAAADVRVLLALALTAGALVMPTASEERVPAPGTRIVITAGALDAIDLGVVRQTARGPGRSAALAPDADAAPARYLAGKVIVKFTAAAPGEIALAAHVGAVPSVRLPYADFDVLTIPADADPEAVARDLSERADVEYAQADYLAEFHFVPNDPLYGDQWSFPALDMERAWDINPGAASSVVVAVLDSGVAFENAIYRYNTRPIIVRSPDGRPETIQHGVIDVPYAAAPDLVAPERIVAPFDFTWNDRHPVDTLGHGTHVAGTIGQLTDNRLGGAGMAFNVRIMPVKVAAGSFWDQVFGAPSPAFSDDQVARAIRYAADNGARAINMSFGRSGPRAPVVEDAVRYAVSKGAFCVFSAGNGGPTARVERYAEIAADVEGAVSVAAVGRDLRRARYSSVGPWVELSAPGGDVAAGGPAGGIVQQTLDEAFFANPRVPPRFDALVYSFFQGTSMAAPHVSGFAALLAQQGLIDPAAMERAMKRWATDLGSEGRDDEYGHGLINPRATLRGVGLAR
jgi:serine protease